MAFAGVAFSPFGPCVRPTVADVLIGALSSAACSPLEQPATAAVTASMATSMGGALAVTLGLWAIVSAMAGPRASDGPRLEQLAEQQAAVRRVATLVAHGAPAEELFAVVAEQVSGVLKVPLVSVVRYEPDGTATERASFSPQGTVFRVGTRWSL